MNAPQRRRLDARFIRVRLVALGIFWISTAIGLSAPARPNVLFLAADDLRMNLGCFGDPIAKTPNIDRLAQRGRIFTRAYCQQALCNPSRSSLLTGLRPDTLRVWNLTRHFRETMPDVVTLPQYFKMHGYFTQNIGKIFHNWRTKIEGDPGSWSVPAVLHFATHGQDAPKVDGRLPANTAKAKQAESRDVPDEAYYDGRVAQEAMRALREVKQRDEPFFLGVGFWKPHTPFNAPKRYWDLYRREDIPPLVNGTRPANAPALAMHQSSEGLVSDREATAELRHGYYAGTSYMDAQVGKVLAELDRLGLRETTVVVFWSDHGFHLGEHGLWGKTSNYELDAHVPLIIATPKLNQAGTPTAALVELLDLFPTLIDLCGLPAKPGLEGVTLRPVIENPAATVKAAAFTQHPRPAQVTVPGEAMGYSIRDARYRLTEWREWTSGRVLATELYDHETDAGETRNVADLPRLSATRTALAWQLERQFPHRALPNE
jgi:iduronate 2-sulfatase